MPMPKSRITRSRRGQRRSHDALQSPTVHNCPNCSALLRPHTVCASCGYYKGREVLAAKD